MTRDQIKDGRSEAQALREVMAELRLKLEVTEEFRALRQLDERERGGNPLESIDGLLFRGRLVRKLEETNSIWRAYVHIEAALGELETGDRGEPGLLRQAVTQPVTEQPIGPPKGPIKSADEKIVAAALPMPNASEGLDIDTTRGSASSFERDQVAPRSPSDEPGDDGTIKSIAGEARPRIKVRAASQVMAPPVGPSATGPGKRSESPDRVSPPASEPRRPVPWQTPVEAAPVQRSVLERIRLVPTIAAAPTAKLPLREPAQPDGMWTTRATDGLPPAIDDVPSATQPGNRPTPDAKSDGIAVEIRPTARPSPAPWAAPVAPVEPSPTHASRSPAIDQQRLDALEAEVDRLVEADVEIEDFGRSAPLPAYDVLPDADGVDLEEAEVTIVKLGAPIEPAISTPAIASPPARQATVATPTPSASRRDDRDAHSRSDQHRRPESVRAPVRVPEQQPIREPDLERDDNGAYLDVEEAAVEIISAPRTHPMREPEPQTGRRLGPRREPLE